MTDDQPASGDEQHPADATAPATAPERQPGDEPTVPVRPPDGVVERPDHPGERPDHPGEQPAATELTAEFRDEGPPAAGQPHDGPAAARTAPESPGEESTTRLRPPGRPVPVSEPLIVTSRPPDGGTADEPGQETRRLTPAAAPAAPGGDLEHTGTPGGTPAPWRRLSSAGALICLLLALFGFTLVVQLRSNATDEGLASARQEDLVRILSDLEARDTRLQSEIAALETSQRQLSSGVAGREAAVQEAEKRAEELGLLAGTLPGRGQGLRIVMDGVKASAILNAVQELRGSGGEVMELSGSGGPAVRIVASSFFVDADGGGIVVDGTRLAAPYTLSVIGAPQTMQTALQIPGGVVASVNSGGGSVTMEQRTMVEVTAVREARSLQYARPVS